MSIYQKGGGVEKKWVDIAQNGAFPSATATGALTLLNTLSQGTTPNTRVGTRVEVKSIAIKGLVQAGTGAGNTLEPLRIKIVYDKEANGAAPAATDILVNDFIYGHNNLANGGRFITLMDKIYEPLIPSIGASQIGTGGSIVINEYIKCNLPVKYNTGNAGTIADIVSGSIYMLTYSCGGTTGTSTGADSIISRVRYTDI